MHQQGSYWLRHYAQAYLLDHFGAEEVSKANLIYGQWLAVQSGRTPQGDVFWRIFRRHDLKTTNAVVAGAIDDALRTLRSLRPPADTIPESPPSAVGSIEHLPVLRPIMTRLYQFAAMNRKTGLELANKSLDATYVGFRAGTVIQPTSVVSPDDATELHAFLARILEGIERDWANRDVNLRQAQQLGNSISEMFDSIEAEQGSRPPPMNTPDFSEPRTT